MHADDPLKLEALLAESFDRSVSVWWEAAGALKIVISRVDDHSRLEILAVNDEGTWALTDGGLTADLLDNGLDFVIEKLEDAEPELSRSGREIVATVDDANLVAGITGYVSNLEFIPVLDGLWSNVDSDFDMDAEAEGLSEFDSFADA